MSNYLSIIRQNLRAAFDRPVEELEAALPARRQGQGLIFRAFGQDCLIDAGRITLSGAHEDGPRGLLVSLYAAHAAPEEIRVEPLKAFKDFPGSMPYQGAFSVNSERILVPHVPSVHKARDRVIRAFEGEASPTDVGGDFSFLLYPFPKIALCYIFYLADDEFPPSVTCLFSSNALSFIPLDGLADVAEYTSRGIIEVVKGT